MNWHREGDADMQIREITIQRKVWEIILCKNRYGKKFLIAKQRTIYDTIIEVKLFTMSDGVSFARPNNPKDLVEDDVLTELKKKLIELQKEYCGEERNRW